MRPLTTTEISDLLAAGDWYSSVVVVKAEQLRADRAWETRRGGRLVGRAGDWLVSEDGDHWTVTAEVFAQTYKPTDVHGHYRKTARVRAVRMARRFLVETLEGPVPGEANDWLVQNPGGDAWPIDAKTFERRYTVAP